MERTFVLCAHVCVVCTRDNKFLCQYRPFRNNYGHAGSTDSSVYFCFYQGNYMERTFVTNIV